ncbi:MAG: orotate phosphoribosyltransferase [Deltaproteobacteria bacterium]|nr:orotate phosphoribosyltransferase [Deltaproteobacteria bacterium]
MLQRSARGSAAFPAELAADRRRFLSLLKEKSYEKRKVVLSSGRESDFYIDCRQTTLDAEGALLTGRLFCSMLETGERPEAVGGITLGADPIVTAVSLTSVLRGWPVPAFIIRKEPKKHGTAQWIEGTKNLRPGMRVAILEDVVTTGASTLRAIERAVGAGLVVVRVLCLVDRNEGGSDAVAKEGYTVEPMFVKEDVENA